MNVSKQIIRNPIQIEKYRFYTLHSTTVNTGVFLICIRGANAGGAALKDKISYSRQSACNADRCYYYQGLRICLKKSK